MTVRWKPLLILSGLFVVVALAGLMTIATVMGSRGSADFVARARTERKAKEYEKAKLDYQIALKSDGRNAALHEELADLYQEWISAAPEDKKADLRTLYIGSLSSAKKADTKRVEPRKRLLAEYLKLDDQIEQVTIAKDLITLDPADGDANYVLAADELEGMLSPNIAEVRRHLKVLEADAPNRARTDWVAARVAQLINDKDQLRKILDKSRLIGLDRETSPTDRMARLKLRVLDVAETSDPSGLSDRVGAMKRDALAISAESEIPSTRIARISLLIEEVQRDLIARSIKNPAIRDRYKADGDSLDEAAESIFKRSLDVKGGADLNVYLAYADHLRFRDHRDQCLSVAIQGLKSPAATKQASYETAMGLHALAVEAYLANLGDKGRYESSAPHIKALIESKHERFQALGHLFQGAIELEKAGLVADANNPNLPANEQAKLRASALGHLKIAAAQLPRLAEAQARYGVALILNQEPAMGRQYLQLAQRLENLEPQYQIWTAYSVIQAGYPEDAEPIVASMLQAVEQGRLPRSYEGTIHLLKGEIYQARKSPADLKKAVEEYTKAFANGQDATPAVELRLAQIEVMLGRPADALKRIDWLAQKGKAGPTAENLAIMTLIDLNRAADARKRLEAARIAFPDSAELTTLEASLLLKDQSPEKADKVLAEFLGKYPDNVAAAQQRAQILVDELDRPAEARKLLKSVGERAENSAPLVQLALIELKQNDYDAASRTIADVRKRWKDAATGDILDAQMALAKNDGVAASAFFDAALKKDPKNKVVQYHKARLDGQADPLGASKVFEALAKDRSIKEIDTGLTLVTASQSALASIAMESGDLDSAIAQYRDMLRAGGTPRIVREIRWKLVNAQAAKKEWPAARAEMMGLIDDPKSPPTAEDRVRAATYLRMFKEDAAALAQAEEALKIDPTTSGAIVTKAEILSRTGKHAEASATIRTGIDATTKAGRKAPAALHLMLAAVESVTPPTETGFERALTVLDQGLAQVPDSEELILAKTKVLIRTRGLKAGADFLEAKTKEDPKGIYRQMLLATYKDHGDYISAERVAEQMSSDEPDNAKIAAFRVQMIAAQVGNLMANGQLDEARRADERAAKLIYEDRAKFKNDPTFLQLDCEMAIRKGDLTHALSLTQEIDAMAKNAAVGPLLRARIYSIKDQAREASAAYAEALSRNPRLADARLQLARLSLQANQTDEAIRQARYLQDADSDKPITLAALLVEARATAMANGTSSQVQANRAKAIEKLSAALRDKPDFVDAAHLIAEIQMMNGDRARAVATLKGSLKANPNDDAGLTMAIQMLTEPRGKNQGPTKAEVDDAKGLAKTYGDNDAKGDKVQAIAAGFSRANQNDLALPYAEQAAAKLKTTSAHLGLGDLLLTMSEAQADKAKAKSMLRRALEEYDTILAAKPDLVEAVNNKAWILHSYYNQSKDALNLAQGLISRVDPSVLPGEFYDTLGSIQEELGQGSDAEESYKKGLLKSPDHPVLNYHLGKLLLADKSRARKAGEYLKVAQQGSERLPAAMALDLHSLLIQVPN